MHDVTDAQVKQVVKAYQERLEREGYRPAQIALDADERERTMRWFGFTQGVLWAHGIHAVDELREQNRAAVRG